MSEIKIKKSTVWMIVMGIVILGLFFVLRNNGSSGEEIEITEKVGSQIGDIAPEFSIVDVNSNQISLSQFKGKPVVLAFFATWCVPCQIEAKRVKQTDDETGGDKFEVYQIGIDNRETLNDLQKFKFEFGNEDWIVGFGSDIAQQYNVRALDTTLVLDKEGNIVYRDNGVPAGIEELRKYLT